MNVFGATSRWAWVGVCCAWVGLSGVAAQGAAHRLSAWTQGTIVAADSAHHVFSFVPGGGRSPVLLAWDGHTHEWELAQITRPGQAVDSKALKTGRPARVLVERQGKSLLARRIIFLSPMPELSRTS